MHFLILVIATLLFYLLNHYKIDGSYIWIKQMLSKVTKSIAVFVMLIALIGQASAAMLASNSHASSAYNLPISKISDQISAGYHQAFNAHTCHLVDNPRNGSGLSEKACGESSVCLSLHCSTLFLGLGFSLDTPGKVTVQQFSAESPQLLVPKTSSPYRPPIFL